MKSERYYLDSNIICFIAEDENMSELTTEVKDI